MNRKQAVKLYLVLTFILLSLGGWLLHFRIHNPAAMPHGYLPFLAGLISFLVLPALFWFGRTVAYAFVINTILVIIGTIAMTHASIAYFKMPLTPYNLIFNTLLADIAILWGNFFVGRAIFDLERTEQDTLPAVGLRRFFRYPNTGWVLAHLVALSLVYALGHLLWR